LESHWGSFFTKDDFEEIAQAGLNAVRIPVGYWAVDVLEYEPYVQGQYPYLIQAVLWASSLNLTVSIDLHGVPGSQNGQDNSGLIGPVLFPSNGSNVERSLGVLRNLSIEFGRDVYGGAVKSIELLNEPRLSSTGNIFTMNELKSYYINGTGIVLGNSQGLNVTYHDAFWGPTYWQSFNPVNPSSTTPAPNIVLDTHQYYAFAPLNNLPHQTILQGICNISQLLKSGIEEGVVPYTVVGEWSLETGNAPNTTSSSQNRGDTQAKRTWLRLLFEAQLAAYSPRGSGEASLGWYFWTWKTEYDIDTWSYRQGIYQGYIPPDVSNASNLVYPILDNGCVDAGFNYTAPKRPGVQGGADRVGVGWTELGMCLGAIGLSLLVGVKLGV